MDRDGKNRHRNEQGNGPGNEQKTGRETGRKKGRMKELGAALSMELREHRSSFIVFFTLRILVIAMLWALGICSKAEFPLIIDTPLARLDSVHRTSLIENYFPKASDQVIILSTDQEITEKDYRELKKYVGREYTLVYDVETMSSSIRPGYFGGNRT